MRSDFRMFAYRRIGCLSVTNFYRNANARAFAAICRVNVECETRHSAGILVGSQLLVALTGLLFKTAFLFSLFYCPTLSVLVKISFKNCLSHKKYPCKIKLFHKKRLYSLLSITIINFNFIKFSFRYQMFCFYIINNNY